MSEPTPAGQLRAAATLLRERAEAATPGPWAWNSYNGVFSVPRVREYDPWLDTVGDDHSEERHGECRACGKSEGGCDLAGEFYRRNPRVAGVPAQYGDTATGQHAADAQLIELMHPGVALALADSLDAIAKHTSIGWEMGLDARPILDLARAVLEAK
jgi:hypothetical protein